MGKLYCVLFFCGIWSFYTFPQEYLYPVASVNYGGRSCIYLIHQVSSHYLELLVWDPVTTRARKVLLSRYQPAGLTMLPDNSGFCFFDDGRIRIKKFLKRSPRLLEIDEPLYEISPITWIDAHTLCISAKQRQRRSIFTVDLYGTVTPLVVSDSYDCMYPQLAGDTLFYLEQLHEECSTTRICSVIYDRFTNTVDYATRQVCIENVGSHSAFLHMLSDQEGFLLSYPPSIDRQDRTIPFSYYHIVLVDGAWGLRKLFDFTLPTQLLLPQSDARLYESILPLLPCYHNGMIYYVDCVVGKFHRRSLNTALYRYDCITGEISCIAQPQNRHHQLFSLYLVNGKLYIGGAVTDQEGASPSMRLNDDGILCVVMATL